MKVSEWLREYQLTGKVPDHPDHNEAALAFWAGWLIGAGRQGSVVVSLADGLEMAIKAAEFIEEHAIRS